jgi:hypothetical protein
MRAYKAVYVLIGATAAAFLALAMIAKGSRPADTPILVPASIPVRPAPPPPKPKPAPATKLARPA